MDSGKQLLKNLLLSAINVKESHGIDVKELSFDNSELKIFLENFKTPEDILELKKPLLNKVLSEIKPENAREKLIAEINFIIGLAELSKKDNEKLDLDKEQLLKLEELKEIINDSIQKNDFNIKYIEENSSLDKENYRKLLKTLQTDQIFTSDDYDLIENLVKLITPENFYVNQDKIYTYFNISNARKLLNKYTGPKRKAKIELTLTKIESINKDTEKKEVKERSMKIKKAPEKVDDVKKTAKPELKSLNHEVINESFFEFINMDENDNNAILAHAEITQKLKEIFATLGFNYDEFNVELKKELETEDLKTLENQARYLIKEKTILSKVKSKNINAIVYLISRSSSKLIDSVAQILEQKFNIKSAGGELFKIVNYATIIFGEKESANFKENAKIFKKYDIDINKLISENINFLYTDNDILIETIKYLERYNANIKNIIENCSIAIGSKFTFAEKPNLLTKNIEVLKMYGFNLKKFFNEEDTYYTILKTEYLIDKIDQLIEVGLSEYIHGNEKYAGNTLKTLIIKRNYYAWKNNLDVWNSPKIEYNRLNKAYPDEQITYDKFLKIKKHIKDSNELITEEEISLIKSDYPIMMIVDESTRPSIYSDTPLALLKRKTELIYGTQIISRQKAFRVFKSLIKYGFKEKKALLFALMHDSILEEKEYEYIKETVKNMGVDKIEPQLFKAL